MKINITVDFSGRFGLVKFALVMIVILGSLLVACGKPSTIETKQTEKVRDQQQIYDINQPIPRFLWSLQRHILIQIYEFMNKSYTSHTFITAAGSGALIYDCASTGLPIPADTQLTNPQQIEQYGQYWAVTVGQPEPQGVFTSGSTDATYVICNLEEGQKGLVYTEQKVTTFSYPVRYENGRIVDIKGQRPAVSVNVTQPADSELPSQRGQQTIKPSVKP